MGVQSTNQTMSIMQWEQCPIIICSQYVLMTFTKFRWQLVLNAT